MISKDKNTKFVRVSKEDKFEDKLDHSRGDGLYLKKRTR